MLLVINSFLLSSPKDLSLGEIPKKFPGSVSGAALVDGVVPWQCQHCQSCWETLMSLGFTCPNLLSNHLWFIP